MIAFHLPIIPPKATSQGAGKRIVVMAGRPMFFKNGKAQSAENDLTLLCSRHRPAKAFDGPVSLSVDYVFPWRAAEPLKRRKLGRVPHTSKPDCSNMVKMLEDVLTKLEFWTDDSLVASLQVTKAWGDQVGIYVRIETLPITPHHPPAAAGQPELFNEQ
jgi:Holliday junction resolvase RusA-like endonuclease